LSRTPDDDEDEDDDDDDDEPPSKRKYRESDSAVKAMSYDDAKRIKNERVRKNYEKRLSKYEAKPPPVSIADDDDDDDDKDDDGGGKTTRTAPQYKSLLKDKVKGNNKHHKHHKNGRSNGGGGGTPAAHAHNKGNSSNEIRLSMTDEILQTAASAMDTPVGMDEASRKELSLFYNKETQDRYDEFEMNTWSSESSENSENVTKKYLKDPITPAPDDLDKKHGNKQKKKKHGMPKLSGAVKIEVITPAAHKNDEDDDDEDDEDDDEEYDPTTDHQQQMRDEIEDRVSDEQLENDRTDIEQTIAESNAPLKEVSDADEQKMVNSAEFEDELRAAIANVQQIAKIDKQQLLAMTKELYTNDTGMEPTQEMLAAAFELFSLNPDGDQDCDEDGGKQAEEEDQEEEEEETTAAAAETAEFAQEMESALQHVRNLGRQHRSEFVQQISNTYTELNGVEPSEQQIDAILNRIQLKFEDEAMQEFLDDNVEENDDEEYTPNEEDQKQLDADQKEEVLQELVAQNETEQEQDNDATETETEAETVKKQAVKVLVTPMKKAQAGARVDIYLEQPDTDKKLECASAKFAKIEKKMPSEDDTQRLKNFLETGMLFESQIEAAADDEDNEDDAQEAVSKTERVEKEKENGNDENDDDDDEDDEEYDPAKDSFDYSQDVEDDENMVSDADENDDTSNMIDID